MGFITKSNIATTCDFGSQMSQYASLVALGKERNLTPIFIKETLDERWGFPLREPFTHLPTEIPSSEIKSDETFDVTDDVGLFSYFHHIKSEIVELYTFKDEIKDFCTKYLDSIKSPGEELVSIHFRRGDYLNVSSLNLSLDYYNKAVKYLSLKHPEKQFKFLIFSNGMEWCKENINYDNCVFVENLTRYQDMCLMSMCDYNIIANSSFSWWGAYLNPSPKEVICSYDYLDVPELNETFNGNWFPKEWTAIISK